MKFERERFYRQFYRSFSCEDLLNQECIPKMSTNGGHCGEYAPRDCKKINFSSKITVAVKVDI